MFIPVLSVVVGMLGGLMAKKLPTTPPLTTGGAFLLKIIFYIYALVFVTKVDSLTVDIFNQTYDV